MVLAMDPRWRIARDTFFAFDPDREIEGVLAHPFVENRVPLWIESLICPLSIDGRTIDHCLAIEDYEPMGALDIEALPPVGERGGVPFKKASE